MPVHANIIQFEPVLLHLVYEDNTVENCSLVYVCLVYVAD